METSCKYCFSSYTHTNCPVLLPCPEVVCSKCYKHIFEKNNQTCICLKKCLLPEDPLKHTELSPMLVQSYNQKLIDSIKKRLPVLKNELIPIPSESILDLSRNPKENLPFLEGLFKEVRSFVFDLYNSETYKKGLISKNSEFVDVVDSAKWVCENLDLRANSLPLKKKLRILNKTNAFNLLSFELTKEKIADLRDQNTFNKLLKEKLNCREAQLLGADILWAGHDWKIDFFNPSVFKLCFIVDQPAELFGIGTGFNKKLEQAAKVKKILFYHDQYCLYQSDSWKIDESQVTMNYEFKFPQGIHVMPLTVYSVIIISVPGRAFIRESSSETLSQNNFMITLGEVMPDGFCPSIIEKSPISFFRISKLA